MRHYKVQKLHQLELKLYEEIVNINRTDEISSSKLPWIDRIHGITFCQLQMLNSCADQRTLT